MRKGIFFSLDALLALIIALSLAAAILNGIGQVPPVSAKENSAQRIAEDSLALMEKNLVLHDSVAASSPVAIQQFAQLIPPNICYRISISKRAAESPIIVDENCGCKTYSVARRSFIVASATPEIYVAEMRSCFK
jgi:hypothetical protein